MDSMPHSPVFDEAKTSHGRTNILIGVVVAVLLVGGGAVYAALQGWVQLPYGLLAPSAPSLEEVGRAVAGVSSGKLTTSFGLQVMDREEGTRELPAFPREAEGVSSTVSSLITSTYLTSDTLLNAEVTTQFRADENPDAEGRLKAAYQSSGLSLSFDVAYRRVGSDLYLQLNTFPIPFLDFPAITGLWVRLNGNDQSSLSFLSMGRNEDARVWERVPPEDEAEKEDTSFLRQEERVSEEFRLVRDELFAHKAFVVRSAELVTDDNGQRVWRMDLSLDAAATHDALQAALLRRPEGETHFLLSDGLRDRVEQQAFIDWLAAVSGTLHSTLDVDPKTHLPVRQSFSMLFTLAADAELPKPRQYRLNLSYVLQDVNAPVSVEAPADALALRQAMQRLLHQTDEEVLFDDQRDIVDDLRSALSAYQKQQGRYPDTLLELVGTVDDRNSYLTQRVARIPDDRYTGQPFAYAATAEGQGYTLAYQLRIPEETSAYLQGVYVEGTNTATPGQRSMEAAAQADTDDDGLTDMEEEQLGTSPVFSDSDRDGFTDKEEVDAGYDPLTNGKTGKRYGPF